MTVFEWIASGGMLAVVVFVLQAARANDAKVNRLFQRLDETKLSQEERYTRKDVCAILHTQLHSDIAELKADMKLILKQISKDREGS